MHISLGVLGWGCPKRGDAQITVTGNSRKGKDLGGRGWCAQGKVGRRKRFHLSHPLSMHGPLRLVTSHSRFALASMRNRKSLKRRQAVSYD